MKQTNRTNRQKQVDLAIANSDLEYDTAVEMIAGLSQAGFSYQVIASMIYERTSLLVSTQTLRNWRVRQGVIAGE